jgi:hypothetical protein
VRRSACRTIYEIDLVEAHATYLSHLALSNFYGWQSKGGFASARIGERSVVAIADMQRLTVGAHLPPQRCSTRVRSPRDGKKSDPLREGGLDHGS